MSASSIDKTPASKLQLQNDLNFPLRDTPKNGHPAGERFECKFVPDFSKRETRKSFVRMIDYVKEIKKDDPAREIFLHFNNGAIELNEYTTPSAIVTLFNDTRKVPENTPDQKRAEQMSAELAGATPRADRYVEYLNEKRELNSSRSLHK